MEKILHQFSELPNTAAAPELEMPDVAPNLLHTVLRTHDGYQVVYPTPGCNVPTLVCSCRTRAAATRIAERLNQEQIGQEMANAIEHDLREMRRIRPQTIFTGERA
jgi:hypothetical protein